MYTYIFMHSYTYILIPANTHVLPYTSTVPISKQRSHCMNTRERMPLPYRRTSKTEMWQEAWKLENPLGQHCRPRHKEDSLMLLKLAWQSCE